MLDAACAGGTADIAATPHSNPEFVFSRAAAEDLRRRLQEAVGDRIRIHLGCDLHLEADGVERAIADPSSYSLGGNSYLLVEPPEFLPAKTISEVCKRLYSAGLRPILTHPERYASLQSRERQIELWVEEGIRMQVTGGSLLGRFGSAARKTAERMIANGWAHFLASDAHNTGARSPDLSDVYRLVDDRWGHAVAAQLLERNPRCALEGEPVKSVAIQARAGWLSFVR
jgi:protein-tyrosine phosphatase